MPDSMSEFRGDIAGNRGTRMGANGDKQTSQCFRELSAGRREECFRMESVSGEDVSRCVNLVPGVSSSMGGRALTRRAIETWTTVVPMAVTRAELRPAFLSVALVPRSVKI